MWNQIGTDDRAYGIECGVQGNVETLRLPEISLDGSIPLEIQHLPGLKNIDFADNRIAGVLPSSLENLPLLQNINVIDN
jgi:Leucine-rich repeat (LRR) protein